MFRAYGMRSTMSRRALKSLFDRNSSPWACRAVARRANLHSAVAHVLGFVGPVLFALTPAAASDTVTYTYDERGRLTQAAHSGTANNGIISSYSYDKANNRVDSNVVGAVTPAFSVNDVSVTEGGSLTFTVTKTGSTGAAFTVDYATANGTATAGSDYTAIAPGTLAFGPSDTSKTISVLTTNDTVVESNETVLLNLSNSSAGSTISDAQGVGTIVDNDTAAPSFAVANASSTEGGNLVFKITMTGKTTSSFSVSYATANGTAVSGSDYTAKSGTLTFAATATSPTTKNVSVVTIDDTAVEGNETVKLNLSGATGGATISDAQGVGTIVDNDSAGPSFSINDVSAQEGGTLTFAVTKTGTTSNTYSVNFATADDLARAPSDYTATSGTLTFAPADTVKYISVVTRSDSLAESDEDMYVNLSGATTGSTITKSQGIGTILDGSCNVSPSTC